MNPRFLLFAIVMGGTLAIHLAAFLIYMQQKNRRRRKRVFALVKQVQVQFEGWYVVAVWADSRTGQNYTFRSPCIELRLKQRVGDLVRVDFYLDNPRQYRMKL